MNPSVNEVLGEVVAGQVVEEGSQADQELEEDRELEEFERCARSLDY